MKRIQFVKTFYLILVLLLLASCSLLSPVKVKPENIYVIKSVPHLRSKSHRPVTLVVNFPETFSPFNTQQIAYSLRPYQIAFYSQSHWAATPSQMLYPLIIQSLQRSHYFKQVVSENFIGHSDYALHTQIFDLQQNFCYSPPRLQLLVQAQMTKVSLNEVIATKILSIEEPLPCEDAYGGAIAANRATKRLLVELTNFCQKIAK